jgi:hypothetical protein
MPKSPKIQPSSNAENLGDHVRDNRMASDGRKLEDEDHVGARSPDSDADVEAEEANADPQPDPPAKGEKEPRH